MQKDNTQSEFVRLGTNQIENNREILIQNGRECHSELRIQKIPDQDLKQIIEENNDKQKDDSNNEREGNQSNEQRRKYMAVRQMEYIQQLYRQVIMQNINYFSQIVAQSSSEDEQPNIPQFNIECSNQQQKTGFKKSMVESIKHLSNLFFKQFPYLIAAFVLAILLLIIQFNFEIDQNCDLEEIAKKEDRSIDNKCPLESYVLIQLGNITTQYFRQLITSLLVVNTTQMRQRKLLQYILFTVATINLLVYIVFQNMSVFRMFSEFTVVVSFIMILMNIMNRHNVGIIFYKLFHILMMVFTVGFIAYLNVLQRDSKSLLSSIVLQYGTVLVKKMLQIILASRLDNDLYYDDVSIYYTFIIITEYTFIFEYVLIQDTLLFQKVVPIINFVIIQTQNINKISLFYKFYQFLLETKWISVSRMVVFQYFLIFLFAVYQLMSIFVSELYIFIIVLILLKFLNRISKVDNEMAQQSQREAARMNGYYDWKIDKSQIDDYVCQQSLIAFLHFIVYQMLLIVVKGIFPENNSISKRYLLIYQIEYQPNNILSLTNVIIFNIVLIILILVLVSIERRNQKLKLIKQQYKCQVHIIWVFITLGMISAMDRRLFLQNAIKQTLKL